MMDVFLTQQNSEKKYMLTKMMVCCLLLLAACQSAKTGLVYIDKGWSAEVSIFKAEDNTPIGFRLSAGQVWLPDEWAKIYGDTTMRYAAGPYVNIGLPYGFYLEPRVECAFYPDLGTPFEPEVGLRFGVRWKSLDFFIGSRYELGNGYRHERLNPPEYEHFPAGFHPEIGIDWGFDF